MDYEKVYKESLEKAKAFAAKYVGDGLLISSEGSVAKEFNEIFQELRESDDERIRKMLIKLVKKHLVNHERCMAESWLEKQGEQKQGYGQKYIADVFEQVGLAKIARKLANDNLTNALQYAMIELSKQGEQKPTWSEEDEKHCQGCLNLMRLSLDTKPYPYYNDYLWLKSLKPNHWKPSEEQMQALETTIHISNFGVDINRLKALESLYNGLKKL